MTTTRENEEQLRAILWGHIKYQETYNEVYDHVLTAIENEHTTNLSFKDTALAIIDMDFGGLSNLKNLERNKTKAISSQVVKSQMLYARDYFKIPSIGFTLFVVIFTCYIANTKLLSVVLLGATFIMLIPIIVVGVRIVKNVLSKKAGKPSVKDNMFNLIAIYGVVLYNAVNATSITRHFKLHQLSQLHVGAIVLVILFYTIYGLSFIKVYRKEIKMQLAS
jgi:hypothetical protein